jgi:ATP:ADP antiporter, AAA family
MPRMPAKSDGTTSGPRTLVTHPELRSHHSFPLFRTIGEAPKSPLERFLSLFADVRAGEGVGVILLAVNIFLLLSGYYWLRSAREALILTDGTLFGLKGPQLAAASAGGQALLLLGVVPLYGWLASRVPRMRLIGMTSIFFVANLLLFYLGGQAGLREGVVFFIWLGIYNVFIVAQFWAFANDLYTEGQGRRLFPLIGVGMSLGAVAGAATVKPLVERFEVTPYTLMVGAAVLIVVALVLTLIVNRRESGRAEPSQAAADKTPLGREGGFELVLKDPYLLWIGVLTILLNVVNTTGGFLLRSLIFAESSRLPGVERQQEFVLLFNSSFDAWVSILGLALQMFVTSRVLRILGVRGSLFILPVLALINYSVIAVAPVLAVVRIGKILENSTDYSIQNTLRQALFLPTSREAKYKAKAAIDTFCTRLGDLAQAGIVLTGTALGLGVPVFAWMNVVLTGVWLAVAGRIAREHRRKTA